jgi:hypothetical protein
VVELGAGTAVPSVRRFAEHAGRPLIRINPREPRIPGGFGVSLAMAALPALTELDRLVTEDDHGRMSSASTALWSVPGTSKTA